MHVRLFPLEIRCTSMEMFYVKLTHVVDDMHLVSLYFIEYAIFKNSWKCNVDILSKISIYDITPTQLNLKSLLIVQIVCEYVQKYWSRLNSIQLTSSHQTRMGTFLCLWWWCLISLKGISDHKRISGLRPERDLGACMNGS